MPRAKNGSWTKIGVIWQKLDFSTKNRNFGPKKRHPLLSPNHGRDRIKLFKEKKCLCPNNQGGKCHFGWFFGVRPIFRPKTFWVIFFDGPDAESQNPISASAMLTGKFLQIQKVFTTGSSLAEEFPDTLQQHKIFRSNAKCQGELDNLENVSG